jgi:hypothetical protein
MTAKKVFQFGAIAQSVEVEIVEELAPVMSIPNFRGS